MKLNEILDKTDMPVSYKANDVKFIATFKPKEGREIMFTAAKQQEGEWGIVFTEKGSTPFRTFSLTGGGQEFLVFATLKKIIKRFIDEKNPDVIQFTADKSEGTGSRADLYQKLFTKFKPAGYELSREDGGREDKFVLSKSVQKDESR